MFARWLVDLLPLCEAAHWNSCFRQVNEGAGVRRTALTAGELPLFIPLTLEAASPEQQVAAINLNVINTGGFKARRLRRRN